MNMTARVKSIEALDEWKGNLKRFVSGTLDKLRSIETEIRQDEEWLQGRLHYWMHVVERCEQDVEEANSALRYCEQNRDNDCSSQAQALHYAYRRLNEAQEELRTVQLWTRIVDEAARGYRLQAERLGQLCSNEMSLADAFLGRVIDKLNVYVSVASPSVDTPVVISPDELEGATIELTGLPQAKPENPSPINLKNFPQSKPKRLSPFRVDKLFSCNAHGSEEEILKLEDSLDILEKTKAGNRFAKVIRDKVKIIEFHALDKNVNAQFNPATDTIWISDKFKKNPPSFIAAYLAHESVHAFQKANLGFHKDVIDEEVSAFTAQVMVWREAKGTKKDYDLDELSKIMSKHWVFRNDIKGRYIKYKLDEHYPR